MVSSLLVDALNDSTKAVTELYTPENARDFGAYVTKHFSDVFQSDAAFHQIPIVDALHAPEHFPDRALVRFRAMVQDTSGNPEMFLSRLPDGKPGGWGIDTPMEDDTHPQMNYSDLRECTVLWSVSIPGESGWCAHELNGQVDSSQPSGTATQAHRPYKLPNSKGCDNIGMQVKIYDSALMATLKSTDCATFVGILTHEATSQDADLDEVTEVPTLHVLFVKSLPHGLLPRPYPSVSVDEKIREDLITWIAEEALGGDREAAEWILLISISRVQSRNPPLLPPSLTVSNFPPPPISTAPSSSVADSADPPTTTKLLPPPAPTLSHILATLLPITSTIPVTLDTLNNTSFAPASSDEDLHAGALQLPQGTLVLLSEGGLVEGTVSSKGLGNVRACQDAMGTQTLSYEFPFSAFAFPTDLSFMVIVPGKSSAFFKTDLNVRLTAESDAKLYKPASEVTMPAEATLHVFRDLVVGARTARPSVSASTSEHIQRDFVTERQQSKISADDLIHRMTVAKLLAQSMHSSEVTIEHWEKTKVLDARRKVRLGS